jgi:hypothetical protein
MMAPARTPTFSEMAPELEQYSVPNESSRLHMLDNFGLLAPASAICFMPRNRNTSTSSDFLIPLFRAQTEHAISESYPTDAAKNYGRSGDAKRPTKVRMSADEDSRDSEADPQSHAQGAIHSPHIQ